MSGPPFTYPPGSNAKPQSSPDPALIEQYDQILASKLQEQEHMHRAHLAAREAQWNLEIEDRRSREAAMEAQMQLLAEQLKQLQAG